MSKAKVSCQLDDDSIEAIKVLKNNSRNVSDIIRKGLKDEANKIIKARKLRLQMENLEAMGFDSPGQNY